MVEERGSNARMQTTQAAFARKRRTRFVAKPKSLRTILQEITEKRRVAAQSVA
jgi:hypothetical protein